MKITSYSHDWRRISDQEILTIPVDQDIDEFFAHHVNVQEVIAIDSMTRAVILSERCNRRRPAPRACMLGGDKMECLTSLLKTRDHNPSCYTRTRCVCKRHLSSPCRVMVFHDSIVKGGDIAITRGDCPMFYVDAHTTSRKPLVRLTKKAYWALTAGQDLVGFPV